MAAPIGYVPVATRGAANPSPSAYGALVTPGSQQVFTDNSVSTNNAVRANARPQDLGERVANASLTGDGSKPDGGY